MFTVGRILDVVRLSHFARFSSIFVLLLLFFFSSIFEERFCLVPVCFFLFFLTHSRTILITKTPSRGRENIYSRRGRVPMLTGCAVHATTRTILCIYKTPSCRLAGNERHECDAIFANLAGKPPPRFFEPSLRLIATTILSTLPPLSYLVSEITIKYCDKSQS